MRWLTLPEVCVHLLGENPSTVRSRRRDLDAVLVTKRVGAQLRYHPEASWFFACHGEPAPSLEDAYDWAEVRPLPSIPATGRPARVGGFVMHAFDRQLDRVRDIPVGVPVAAARPPAGGSVHPAAPVPPTPLAYDAGAATYGCECSHSRHLHRSGQCRADGCACWAYRAIQSTNTRSAPALSPQPGA